MFVTCHPIGRGELKRCIINPRDWRRPFTNTAITDPAALGLAGVLVEPSR